MFVPPELLLLYQRYGTSVFSFSEFYDVITQEGSNHNMSWYFRRKYIASVRVNGKKRYLLTFKSISLCQNYITKRALGQVNL